VDGTLCSSLRFISSLVSSLRNSDSFTATNDDEGRRGEGGIQLDSRRRGREQCLLEGREGYLRRNRRTTKRKSKGTARNREEALPRLKSPRPQKRLTQQKFGIFVGPVLGREGLEEDDDGLFGVFRVELVWCSELFFGDGWRCGWRADDAVRGGEGREREGEGREGRESEELEGGEKRGRRKDEPGNPSPVIYRST